MDKQDKEAVKKKDCTEVESKGWGRGEENKKKKRMQEPQANPENILTSSSLFDIPPYIRFIGNL